MTMLFLSGAWFNVSLQQDYEHPANQ